MNSREAVAITGMPHGEHGEDGIYYSVGDTYRRVVGNSWVTVGMVSRITVTADLPGLHCNMERVRVYDGDTLIFEAPLHSIESVMYAHPAGRAALAQGGEL